MRPAVVALGMALFLFLLVQGIRPPLLYAALLVPIVILIYGLVAEDLPETKFEDDDEGGGNDGEDDGEDLPGETGSSAK